MSGTNVYAGGSFANIGGQARNRIASLDATTGSATSWDPNSNGGVLALALNGPVICAGGTFTSIGGQPRGRLAALDAATGTATSWDPAANSTVYALAVSGSTIYAGGNFTLIGGQPRNRVSAFDATTGSPTGWNPNADSRVSALAVSGSTVYAGGLFTSMGGQARNNLAALDAVTGGAVGWNPNANSTVSALTASGATVCAGGSFTTMQGTSSRGIAAITAAPAISKILPAAGGNAGALTVSVSGSGLPGGTTIKLSRSGQSDIPGTGVAVAEDGLSLTATFELTDAATGPWNVIVTTPDPQTATLVNGFTVTATAAPQLRVDVLGPALIRPNRRMAYDLVIDNPGNVDALDVPLWLTGVPADATLELDFPLSAPSRTGGEPDWAAVPLGFTDSSGRYLPMVIPRVPPGTTVRRCYLTVPSTPAFKLVVAITPPWVDGNVFRGCLTNAGITDGACMGAQLTALYSDLVGSPATAALSGVGVWAKVAWRCETAGSLPAALATAEQVLDFMAQAVEIPDTSLTPCRDVTLPRWRDSLLVTIVSSVDPNDKLGSRDTLSLHQAIPYSIRFENAPTATAPAQDVVVSDPLNLATFDPNTLSLDAITFGSVRVLPPPGLSSYATTVDLRPATNLLVNVAVVFDRVVGVLTWSFKSVDPATGQPPTNPLAGFLPPNVAPPQGEGSVLFTIMPRSTLSGGTQISNTAAIDFDGASHNTPAWQNVVDDTPPTSHVLPLGATSAQTSIPVAWTADGAPPDLRDFTLYVSEDGAPYRVWRLNTSAITDSLMPPGNRHPHTYTFYSVARDLAGNIEPAPAIGDATTQSVLAVEAPGPPSLALEGAQPNPALGVLHVGFTLPDRRAATLELIDVAGRRVLRRDVGALGPGRHSVTLDAGARMRPGLYFLRLEQGARALHSRVAVVR